jgi:hypothetical protein
LLASDSMSVALEELRTFADYVLLDTPPLLSSPDIVALAPHVDGALLVVDASVAQQPSIEQARHELDVIELPILGIVVTNHDPGRFRAVGTGYRYYVEESSLPPVPSMASRPRGSEAETPGIAIDALPREATAGADAGETPETSSVRTIHGAIGREVGGSEEQAEQSSLASPDRPVDPEPSTSPNPLRSTPHP